MRWFFTLMLAAAAAVAVALFAFQDRLRPAKVATGGGSTERLAELADAATVRKVTLTRPGEPPLALTRAADGTWSQPGNWPLRDGEIAALVNTLSGLKSRMTPVAYAAESAADYGLAAAQRPVAVQLDVQTGTLTRTLNLAVGQAPLAAGSSAFSRPTFVRVDDEPEVVQVGPEVYATLARPAEVYRRRQLLPDAERVKFPADAFNPLNPTASAAPGRTAILGDATTAVTYEKPEDGQKVTFTRVLPTPEARRDADRPTAEPSLTLDRFAEAWQLEIAGPAEAGKPTTLREPADPAKLKAVLAATADLWVEGFLPAAKATPALTGLDKPERKITVRRADGKTLTLLLGKVTRTTTKFEEPPRPQPGMPPAPPKATLEEFRAAKLAENDLIFEVRSDALEANFQKPDGYRDARPVRFDAADVTTLTVAIKGQPPLTLVRKPGAKDAERDEDRQDRWTVNGEQLAEQSKVSELLEPLAKLEAKSADAALDKPTAAKLAELGLDAPTRVTLTLQAKPAPGDAAPAPRTVTLLVGKATEAKDVPPEPKKFNPLDPKKDEPKKDGGKTLAVMVPGRDRVYAVEDAVLKFLDRPALAYRSRRLFDTAEAKLTALVVTRDNGEAFAVKSSPKTPPAVGAEWSLTAPVALPTDAAKTDALASTWSRLEATEFVDDAPKPDDLDKKYGLAKPRFTVALTFGGKPTPVTLQLGGPRDGKPETYARLAGGGVFTVPTPLLDGLNAGAVALLAPQLWKLDASKIASVTVTRGEPSNEVTTFDLADGVWKMAKPFDAPVGKAGLDPLVAALADLQAAKFETLAPKNLADYGLDKPTARVTFTADAKPRTVIVGKASPDGTRFAKLDGDPNPAVFTLAGLPQLLDVAAIDRLDKALLALDPAKLAAVTVTPAKADEAVTLTRQPDGTWKAGDAALTLDAPTVNALAALAARPPVARIAAYGPAVKWADFGLDAPTTTVTVEVAATPPEVAAKHTLKLGKTEPTGERYLRVDDGPAVGVLPGRAAEALAKSKLDFVDRTVFAFDPTTLTGLTRTVGKAEFELTPTANGLNWEVTKPAKMKADQATVEELADTLSRLRAVKVAALAPTDLVKPYGLVEPAAVVTLKLGTDKPETKSLKIGAPVDAAKPDGDRYAMIEVAGRPKTVLVIAGATAKRLLGEPIKFRDRSLAKIADADKFVLERGGRTATFAKVDGTWKLTQPVAADAEQGDLDELLNALATLRADELVAEKPADLTPYGLKTPEAKWTLFNADKPVLTLLLGKKDAAGRVHAMLDKGDLVALLDPVLTGKVLGEYRKRAAWSDVDASQLESVILTTTTGNVVLQKQGTAWVDPAKPTDKFDAAKVTELATAFAGLKAERYVADAKADLAVYGLDKPAFVVAVVGRGGATKSLAIGGPEGTSGGKQRYAKVNDPARTDVFLLSEADTAKLTRDRASLLEKAEKK